MKVDQLKNQSNIIMQEENTKPTDMFSKILDTFDC